MSIHMCHLILRLPMVICPCVTCTLRHYQNPWSMYRDGQITAWKLNVEKWMHRKEIEFWLSFQIFHTLGMCKYGVLAGKLNFNITNLWPPMGSFGFLLMGNQFCHYYIFDSITVTVQLKVVFSLSCFRAFLRNSLNSILKS